MNDKDKSYFIKLILASVVFIAFLTVLGLTICLVRNKRVANREPQALISPVILESDYFRNEYVQVKFPQKNTIIKSPVSISGKANVFEGNVRVRIKDKNENILADTFITASGAYDKLYPFEKEISYTSPTSQGGFIEIFDEDVKDGGEINKVIISVIFEDYTDISDWQTYRNEEYGFEITLLDSWKGYSVLVESWTGQALDSNPIAYQGSEIIIRNPKWNVNQPWQDIPIAIFTKEEWKLDLVVSAAPIGPRKLGENQKYVFALPPRWVGFTNALGQDEAQEIVKTFKATDFDETVDWKTYRNEEYGFELKYPSEFDLSETDQEIIIDSLSLDDPMQQSSLGLASKMTITTDKRDIQAIISEYKNNDLDNLSTEQVLINGLKTTKLAYAGAYGGETHFTILIEDKINSKTFVVYYVDDVIFDQILSTFKFTN